MQKWSHENGCCGWDPSASWRTWNRPHSCSLELKVAGFRSHIFRKRLVISTYDVWWPIQSWGLGLEINPILNSLQSWRSDPELSHTEATDSKSVAHSRGKFCDEIGRSQIIPFRARLDGFRKYKGVVIVDWLMEIGFSILSGQSRR